MKEWPVDLPSDSEDNLLLPLFFLFLIALDYIFRAFESLTSQFGKILTKK